MSRLRTLIVDDEPLARGLVRDLLASDEDIEIVGECGDGRSAIERIRETMPDIVFLDVEMPEMSGLDVAASLDDAIMPAIVFVTAYGHHAIEAFDVEALDYLVKPFPDERFFIALERAKKRHHERRLGQLAARLASPSASTSLSGGSETEHLSRITVRNDSKQIIIAVDDVMWLASEDYYARVHTADGSWLVRASLNWFEEHLDPKRFVRVHRTAIANISRVRSIEIKGPGSRELTLTSGTRLPVSRSRRKAVERALGPRLGR